MISNTKLPPVTKAMRFAPKHKGEVSFRGANWNGSHLTFIEIFCEPSLL